MNTCCLPFTLTSKQGSVPVPAFDKPVLLIGRENMNRAVQGDVVAVEVFPESEWKAPADEVVDQESKGCLLHVDHTLIALHQPR